MEIPGARNDYILPTPPPPRDTFLDQSAFLRLLTVQLATQDPLQPMNDRDFFAQLAQMGMVQGLDRLQRNLSLTQGAALIGKRVEVSAPTTDDINGGRVFGVVESVVVDNNRVFVVVNGGRYPMEDIVTILPEAP
ncbi:MAG: flagellar hook capping FlgD N-terminal domain-containing protein [Armatimonadota bacterium]